MQYPFWYISIVRFENLNTKQLRLQLISKNSINYETAKK